MATPARLLALLVWQNGDALADILADMLAGINPTTWMPSPSARYLLGRDADAL